MNALELFAEGRLDDAVQLQDRLVRENPSDDAARLLLAELHLFTGDDNAVCRQLDQLSCERPGMDQYLRIYQQLLAAERTRQCLPVPGQPVLLIEPSEAISYRLEALAALREGNPFSAVNWLDEADACSPWATGHIDGREFNGVRDIDDLFGPVLELLIDDQYAWFPMEAIRRLRVGKIESLRDRIFVPAWLTARCGEEWHVHLPALYPRTHAHADAAIRSGLGTDWHAEQDGPLRGAGLRMLMFGEEEISLHDFTQWET